LWSQPGEPTWAIDERLRRLEERVNRLARVVDDLVRAQHAATAASTTSRGTDESSTPSDT
jgi:hypothetical protein